MFFCRKEKDELARLREELAALREKYEQLKRQHEEVLYECKKRCYARSRDVVRVGGIYMPIIVEPVYDFPIHIKKVDAPLVLRNGMLAFQVPAERDEYLAAAALVYLMRRKDRYTVKYTTRFFTPPTE